WMEFDSPYLNAGRVRVTYNAGFATIPVIVQKCVANVAKNILAVLALDPTLKSETAEKYAYEAREVVELLPLQDRQALAFYRLHHAYSIRPCSARYDQHLLCWWCWICRAGERTELYDSGRWIQSDILTKSKCCQLSV